VSLSKEQIAAYTLHYIGNNRPIQPIDDRMVLEIEVSDETPGR